MNDKQKLQSVRYSGAACIAAMIATMLIGALLSDWYRTNEQALNYWFTVSIIMGAACAWATQDWWQKRCIKKRKESPFHD